MEAAGYGDTLGQRAGEYTLSAPRAQSRVNAWMNTANHMDRNVKNWGFWFKPEKPGNNIDWIFASNSLPVVEYKVVANYDPSTMTGQRRDPVGPQHGPGHDHASLTRPTSRGPRHGVVSIHPGRGPAASKVSGATGSSVQSRRGSGCEHSAPAQVRSRSSSAARVRRRAR